MALLSNWTHPRTKVNHPQSYARIEPRLINTQRKFAQCMVAFYHDRSVADSEWENEPELWKQYQVTGADFTLWFSEDVLKEAGRSIYTQWYGYLHTLLEFQAARDV